MGSTGGDTGDHILTMPAASRSVSSSSITGHRPPVLLRRCHSQGASSAGATWHRLSPPWKRRHGRPCHPHTEPKPPGDSGWRFLRVRRGRGRGTVG